MKIPKQFTRRNFFKKTFQGLAITGFGVKSSDFLFNKSSKTDKIEDIYTFEKFREKLLLKENLAYLNTGSLGPSTGDVVNLINMKVKELEQNPVGNMWGDLGDEAEGVRQKAAKFFGVDKEEIVITRNTTEGMNSVGSGIYLKAGDEVLTTDEEHPGGLVCWEHKEKYHDIGLKKIKLPRPAKNENEIMEAIKKGISNRTKIFSFSHVTTTTGLRMPVKKIVAFLREKGIYSICDGAQATGMIKFNLRDLGVDVYSTSGHKWLCGPKGTGVLFVKNENQKLFHPVFLYSGNNVYTASSGTRDIAKIIGLGRAMDIISSLGVQNIEKRCMALRKYLLQKLEEIEHIQLLSSKNPVLGSALVTVDLKRKEKQEVYNELKERGVIVKLLPRYNSLRFSTHFFNTKDEIDKVVAFLRELV